MCVSSNLLLISEFPGSKRNCRCQGRRKWKNKSEAVFFSLYWHLVANGGTKHKRVVPGENRKLARLKTLWFRYVFILDVLTLCWGLWRCWITKKIKVGLKLRWVKYNLIMSVVRSCSTYLSFCLHYKSAEVFWFLNDAKINRNENFLVGGVLLCI